MAKAVRFDHYGGRDVLYVADVEVPHPAAGEVVVRVKAAGVNPGEAAIREGRLHAAVPRHLPLGGGQRPRRRGPRRGRGRDGVGDRRQRTRLDAEPGRHAQYVVVPAGQLVAKPSALSWAVAGSLYVAGCTAYAAVRAVGAGPSDTVVVSAAARRADRWRCSWSRSAVGGPSGSPRQTTTTGSVRSGSPPWPTARDSLIGSGRRPHRGWTPSSTPSVPSMSTWRSSSAWRRTASTRSSPTTPPRRSAPRPMGVRRGRAPTCSPRWPTWWPRDASSSPSPARIPFEQVADAYAEVEQRHTLGKVVLLP